MGRAPHLYRAGAPWAHRTSRERLPAFSNITFPDNPDPTMTAGESRQEQQADEPRDRTH